MELIAAASKVGSRGPVLRRAHPVGRVVDNYLSADPQLPIPPAAPGPHVNYYALFKNLDYNSEYTYRVQGPGLPAEGFRASFHTRKRTDSFSFEVVGDEGLFPPDPLNAPYLGDYEARRIAHEMFNVQNLTFTGERALPKADLALNTGDNVYFNCSDGNYRDFWMPVWNSDIDSNETGAPFARSILNYVVAGNHDVGGSNGDFANLLADDSGGRFVGNLDGGDALAYFNNFYFPLNGPAGGDMNYVFNGDSRSSNGFYFSYLGENYSSPAAIEAFRASTAVDTGTLVDPTTGAVISPAAQGTPALLDKFTIAKPELFGQLRAHLSAAGTTAPGGEVDYRISITNQSSYALNGVQVELTLPEKIGLIDPLGTNLSQHGHTVVKTIGRLEAGTGEEVVIRCQAASSAFSSAKLTSFAEIRSSTALPVLTNPIEVSVNH